MDQIETEDITADPLLPPAPESEHGSVKAWIQAITLPTYLPEAPDRNPMFLEKRVYQGSSGRVYPLPFTDRIATEPVDHSWQAVHIENEYLRVVILPEIGGRVHIALDKMNGYDFVYRQDVIKPSLVGLAGPWISGGIEFNWPQHHRPATFMATQTQIERGDDGSITVWCSDHDPMSRMKGMHGVRLSPGSSLLEIRVRLHNRTQSTETFLWWANIAARVHERYQSFFPPDVRFIADHAKRAITSFPLSDRPYYGVDYLERARHGVPEAEQPRLFRPDGTYPANDLSWYANIPVPTSYMITGSSGPFFGGYDHSRNAGFVHVANPHIAPGKKQWTWGNHEFGYAWDRNLTDTGGPYIELMAGVFTDNQPDFSFLAPGETKAFSQYLFPIRDLGTPSAANMEAALSLRCEPSGMILSVMVTREFEDAQVTLKSGDRLIERWQTTLTPAHAFVVICKPDSVLDLSRCIVEVEAADGTTILPFTGCLSKPAKEPAQATEPLDPAELETVEELFLTGQHLAQYRHATRLPEPYWREALRRDAGDSRTNNALGLFHLHRGEFAVAEDHFRASIKRLTNRNPNPRDGEPYYNLGLTLRYQDRADDAYASFYKATWNAAWSAPGYNRLAEVDMLRGDWQTAHTHLRMSLDRDRANLSARNLLVSVLRQLGDQHGAKSVLCETLEVDPLDIWARHLDTGELPAKGQDRLDLAFDYARCGMLREAAAVLSGPWPFANDGSRTIALYALAQVLQGLGEARRAAEAAKLAAASSRDYVFPSRVEELILLEKVVQLRPEDAGAAHYLGNLLYDRRRHEDAIVCWERAAALDPAFSITHRNLGIAYFNIQGSVQKALAAFDLAVAAAPEDARLIYERDQLRKRTGWVPKERLSSLLDSITTTQNRDDVAVEIATLYNQLGHPEEALSILHSRAFQPWEGGEGLVLNQFVRAHLLLGQLALRDGKPAEGLQHFLEALCPPQSLGEAKHLLVNVSQTYFWLGMAYFATGEPAEAARCWWQAITQKGDLQQMSVQDISEMTFWTGLANSRLGRQDTAQAIFQSIYDESTALEVRKPKIDFFATSLPAMLLFDEDLAYRNRVTANFLRAQSLYGLGRTGEARELLRKVLAMDVNHAAAADFSQNLQLLAYPKGSV